VISYKTKQNLSTYILFIFILKSPISELAFNASFHQHIRTRMKNLIMLCLLFYLTFFTYKK